MTDDLLLRILPVAGTIAGAVVGGVLGPAGAAFNAWLTRKATAKQERQQIVRARLVQACELAGQALSEAQNFNCEGERRWHQATQASSLSIFQRLAP